jgi:hypothetical protein
MAVPGWPARGPGGLRIWLDRMKAYVDRAGSTAPGAPILMTAADPAIPMEAYPPSVVPNGGGSVTLSGGFTIQGANPGGERRVFDVAPQFLPTKVETHPLAASIIGGTAPGIVPMSLNPLPASSGGGLFLIFPEIPADAFAMVWLDSVSYWPAG